MTATVVNSDKMTGAALQRMQLHEQTVHRLKIECLRAVDQAISSSRDMRLTLNIFIDAHHFPVEVDAADIFSFPGSSLLSWCLAGAFTHSCLKASA